jgi:hypothetical protein
MTGLGLDEGVNRVRIRVSLDVDKDRVGPELG